MNTRLSLLLSGWFVLSCSSMALANETAAPPQPATEAAPAQTAAPKDPEAAAKPVATADDDDTLVCKREKTLGSNFTTKVCRTKAQIRQDQDMASGNLRRGTE